MKRLFRVSVVLLLVLATMLTGEHSDAKKKKQPPIPFNACSTLADQPGRTYHMTTGTTCVVAAETGINVTANNITVDLGGFDLTGPNSGNSHGVLINPGVAGTRIKHGTITLFARGIEGSSTTRGTVVSGINSIHNSNFGILLGSATVKNCVVAGNNGAGISMLGIGSGAGVITNTLATRNGSGGMSISNIPTGLIDRSTVTGNLGSHAIFMSADKSTVRRSTSTGNAGDGVDMDGSVANTVDRLHATANGGRGIIFESTALVPLVTRSTVLNNGKAGFEEGLLINTPSGKATVTTNVVEGSFGDGIKLAVGLPALVDGNTANGNGWGVADGANFGINASSAHGHNQARGNDGDSQCVDDTLC